MAVRTYPHSIRFSSDEWRAVTQAAARAATQGFDLDESRLTPELIELFKTIFRGVHVLAYLKRQELVELDRLEDFDRAVGHARSLQDETLGPDGEADES